MSKKHPMINSALRRAGDKFGKDIALSNGDVVKLSKGNWEDDDDFEPLSSVDLDMIRDYASKALGYVGEAIDGVNMDPAINESSKAYHLSDEFDALFDRLFDLIDEVKVVD